jgi:glycosyltransferase involved in cell wall biosynthesis
VRHKLDLRTRFRIRRLFDEHRIEILHTITGRDAYVGIKARGRRPIHTFVRRGAYAPISRFDPADRVTYGRRGADHFIVVSHDLARHMVAQGLDAEKITPVYTGIWSEDIRPVERDLRGELNLGGDTFLLAHVGNDRKVKGFAFLLDALALLDRRGLDFHLVVAGEDYDEEEIATRGLTARVTLLGFSDVMTVTPNVDCFVLPSRIDALPRALIEATVLGIPAVATRVGGVPEILDDGRGGRLADPNDPAAMADAIADAIEHPEKSRAMADALLPRNRDLFGMDRCVQTHLELYERALASRV